MKIENSINQLIETVLSVGNKNDPKVKRAIKDLLQVFEQESTSVPVSLQLIEGIVGQRMDSPKFQPLPLPEGVIPSPWDTDHQEEPRETIWYGVFDADKNGDPGPGG
ncbi:MAG TPA: hypothetical protein VJC04_03680 [Candidatus Paceibacterota bacterium]